MIHIADDTGLGLRISRVLLGFSNKRDISHA